MLKLWSIWRSFSRLHHSVTADLSAKSLTRPKHSFRVLDPVVYRNITQHFILTEWNSLWQSSKTGRILFGLKPNIPLTWKFNCHRRHDQSILDQVRMDCVLLNSRKFRFNLHEDGLCSHCQVPEDLTHFISDCRSKDSAAVAIRGKLNLLPTENIPFTLSELVDNLVLSKLIIAAARKRLLPMSYPLS